jgi:hypothetical protein
MAYSTLIESEVYFQNRLHILSWTTASNSDKTKALEEASQRMDRLSFSGAKVDDAQVAEFPRYYGTAVVGDEVVPEEIKKSCNEIAFSLLDGAEPEKEFAELSKSGQAFSGVRVNYDRESIPAHTVNGIPSLLGWHYLKPYLASAKQIRLVRVS